MRIVFMGTPDFAVPCLQRLIADGHDVVGVFTQPDKPKGRGYVLCPPPVKVEAEKHHIPVFQPSSMKSSKAFQMLSDLKPELSIVVAYGQILPPDILYLPKHHSINIHASLLPKYRGAAPIQRAILDGEKKTGVTSMLMNEGLDTGDMLLQKEIEIAENMTGGELHDALSLLAADVMSETISLLSLHQLNPVKQEGNSNYAAMLSKSLCPVSFQKTAQEVHNQIRGLSPWPVATAEFLNKKFKLHVSRIGESSLKEVGSIFVKENALHIVCGDHITVKILELQQEGKKRMSTKDFLVGHTIPDGTKVSLVAEG